MSETRRFKPHPQLLLDVIQRQAGTLSKALLEATMNAVDAKATRCDIEVTAKRATVVDDGRGFAGRAEIEQFFEVFGQPHQKADAVYGRFRMGRGQLFAFGANRWRSNTFEMLVNVKQDGLDYGLTDKLRPFPGCQIEIELYQPLTNGEVYEVEREFGTFAAYVSIPVTINGKQVSKPPATEKWDMELLQGYISFRNTAALKVYNLGVLVREYPAGDFGTGGIVVSKLPLTINFARNDVMSSCKVWRTLRNAVKQETDRKPQSRTLTDVERQRSSGMFSSVEGGVAMAAGTLPKPGTELGPCEAVCVHSDCELTRAMAKTKCRICGKVIGYDTRFFQEEGDWHNLVHAACLEAEAEAN